MKVKTSVSLSKECLDDLDSFVVEGTNRSALVEEAVVEYVERRRRKARGHKDRILIDKHAESLARDVRETLDFQASE